MSSNLVDDYGWDKDIAPGSCNYITPKILNLLSRFESSRVCDLGSGNGALVRALGVAGHYVAGVEYDAKGFELSRRLSPGINFYNLGVQDDPSLIIEGENELFDVVVSTEVIEHLFSPHLLPVFAKKLLKPNGILIVTTPYHGYLKNLALSIAGKWDSHHTPLWHGGHIKFWSRATLTKLLEDNGFCVTVFHGVGRLPFLWKSMVLVAKVK